MKKWNLIVDVAKCENCNNCVLSVKDEHVGNSFPGYAAPQPLHGHNWIKITRKVRGVTPMVDSAYLTTTCNHCDNAPCVAAGRGAVIKREDGIVIIDPEKAKGRKDLVESCPYGAIWWNEKEQVPQKWIFDAHLLDNGWKEPRCVQVCPTGALRSMHVEDAEMQAFVQREKLQVLKPELATRPRVHYRNLHRFTTCFVGGSVIADIDGISECISGAEVVLIKGQQVIDTASSDAFGDFKFDGLAPSSGRYRVDVSHPQSGKTSAQVEIVGGDSVYIGTLKIEVNASRNK